MIRVREKTRLLVAAFALVIVAAVAIWGARLLTEQAEAQPASGDTVQVEVTRVVDGDTIEVSPSVEGTADVRLIGIDTPETVDPNEPVEPCGPEASAFTKEQLEGQQVELEFDEERIDPYDRALAYVFKGGELFNETLVRQGYARVTTFEPNVKYEDRFLAAEEEARAEEIGIWADSGCSYAGGDPEPTTPEPTTPEPTPEPTSPEPAPEPVPRFHDLRHTCATLLLTRNVHPKLVQEPLGHATISVTLDTYSHFLPSMGDQTVRAMEAALGSAP